jgi:hypothetical protein
MSRPGKASARRQGALRLILANAIFEAVLAAFVVRFAGFVDFQTLLPAIIVEWAPDARVRNLPFRSLAF